jgi:hypothetical protein
MPQKDAARIRSAVNRYLAVYFMILEHGLEIAQSATDCFPKTYYMYSPKSFSMPRSAAYRKATSAGISPSAQACVSQNTIYQPLGVNKATWRK